MEIPEAVRVGLANVRPTLHARWNPQGKQTGGHSFDANGQPRHKTFEGRWELWDKSEGGLEYKVTTLEKDGKFVPLGEWVCQLVHQINPATYGGDLHRMIDELVDKPNTDIERLGNKQFEELVAYLGDLCWSVTHKESRIVVPQPMV